MTNNFQNIDIPELLQNFGCENFAQEAFEKWRWPDGTICPRCGNSNQTRLYKIKPNLAVGTRNGLWYCGACRRQFSATSGTIFNGTHVPISKWILAVIIFYLSRKSYNARTLQTTLGVTWRTAWKMARRLRRAKGLGLTVINRDGSYMRRKKHQRPLKQTTKIRRRIFDILSSFKGGMTTHRIHHEIQKQWPFISLQSICSILGQNRLLEFNQSAGKWTANKSRLMPWNEYKKTIDSMNFVRALKKTVQKLFA